MANTILPETFGEGNFSLWLQQFQHCALANSWDEATRLVKLPAFLQGPAATYFESLPADQKDTFDSLTSSLLACFSPLVHRECHYREFENMTLRTSEDPTLFLWRLKECLRSAEPDLSASAFDALLRCQFMKALLSSIKLKLLEIDPTPSLERILSFAQRVRALHDLSSKGGDISTCGATSDAAPPQSVANGLHQIEATQKQQEARLCQLQSSLDNLVSSLSTKPPAPPANRSHPVICFCCLNEGHFARNCQVRLSKPQQTQSGQPPYCNLCAGHGHFPQDCGNHKYRNFQNCESSFHSLNYQGVPR